jgi:dUTPase
MIEIALKLLDEGLPLPRYQHEGDAGGFGSTGTKT